MELRTAHTNGSEAVVKPTPRPRKPKMPANPNAGRALVVQPEKQYKLTPEQRKAARDKYHERKKAGKLVRGKKAAKSEDIEQVLSEMADLIGMQIANANNNLLGLKMLQERVLSMQHKVKR